MWAGSSVVALLVGAFVLALAPGAHREADRYRGAKPCRGRAVEPPTCVERVQGEIVEKERRRKRREDKFFVEVRVGELATLKPERQPERVEIEAFADWDRLQEGQTVELTLWGRAIARIRPPDRGVAIETNDSPLEEEAGTLTFGPIIVLGGAFGLWTAHRMRRASGSWWGKTTMPTAKRVRPLGCGLIVAPLFAVLTYAIGMFDMFAVVLFSLIGLALGALAGVVLKWWQARRSE